MFYQWFRKQYKLTVNSIAFYPALIAVGFFLLSYFMLIIDYSEYGINLKSRFSWMTLKDATTARAIASTIAGGVLSLAVFSFSMVMILLVQAATNLSNRILDTMVGNRFQQLVLGCYIGTIVYALFILSTIRNVDSGTSIPALSIYVLIALTIIDIFLFIYFLHYITESVKYQTVISKVHQKSMDSLKQVCDAEFSIATPSIPTPFHKQEIFSERSGYYQGFDKDKLTQACAEKNYYMEITVLPGKHVLKGRLLAYIHTEKELSDEETNDLRAYFDFFDGQPIPKNPYYGFFQLMEIAIKALSPGINDPGTAILSLHALTDLLCYRLEHPEKNQEKDKEGKARVLWHPLPFTEIFNKSIIPVWEYGKNDYLIRHEMADLLGQLKKQCRNEEDSQLIGRLYLTVSATMKEKLKDF